MGSENWCVFYIPHIHRKILQWQDIQELLHGRYEVDFNDDCKGLYDVMCPFLSSVGWVTF